MGANEGTEQASAIGRASAEFQQLVANMALPALAQSAGAMLQDLGRPGEIPLSVRRAFGEARQMTQRDFAQARAGGAATVSQAALQSGLGYSPAAVSDATQLFENQLDQVRARRQRGLQFAEAQGGQSQTNFLLSSLNQTSGQMFGGALGFGQNALTGAGILSQLSQQQGQQGATYGSIAGAILGSIISPGVGTALGSAVGGAAGGYFGGR